MEELGPPAWRVRMLGVGGGGRRLERVKWECERGEGGMRREKAYRRGGFMRFLKVRDEGR